jgi:hypothetical protein
VPVNEVNCNLEDGGDGQLFGTCVLVVGCAESPQHSVAAGKIEKLVNISNERASLYCLLSRWSVRGQGGWYAAAYIIDASRA